MKSVDTHGYEKELRAAMDAVSQASILCRAVQAEIAPGTLEKKDRSPVTVADFGSQALVCRIIHEAFPDDPIIAEEDSKALRDPQNNQILERLVGHVRALHASTPTDEICSWIDYGGAAQYSERFWTLDPIDGTKGFLRGDQYAISLALIVGGELTVAVLGCPNLSMGSDNKGALLFAVRGAGAFVLDADSGSQPIHVSNIEDTTMIRFCESFEAAHTSHGDSAAIAQELGIVASPVRIDSQAKYAVVATGEGDAYLRMPRGDSYREKIWDHAGGALIVTEAGGKVTDLHGKPLVFTHGRTLEENRGVIVSNGLVHNSILETIRRLGLD